MWPKVSILVPAYNEEVVIRDTLDQLVNEIEYPNKEIIVGVDDGADKTLEIAKEFEERYPALVRVYYSPTRQGVTTTVNEMLQMATGEVIFKNDADVRANNPKNCIHNLVKQYEDENTGALVCPMGDFSKSGEKQKSLVTRGELLINEIAVEASRKYFPIKSGSPLTAAVHSWRREIFSQHQNPEDIVHDDAVVAQVVLRKGFQIDIAKDTWYFVGAPTTCKDLLNQKIKGYIGWKQISDRYDNVRPTYFYNICFNYFLRNIRRYSIRDIISLGIWFLIFVLSRLLGMFRRSKKPTDIWIRWDRKIG